MTASATPHSSTMAEQTEKAFLKQPKVFLRKPVRERGLGRVETGSGRALGWASRPLARLLKAHILTRNAHSLALFLSEAVFWLRHSNIPAHISPCFRVKEGDHVIIGQCRPLSKTVRFNVLKVIPAGSSGGAKKAFTAI
ncbi:hypothetical protein Tsubulata_002761 [Turnera subulata]|uniref:40S ribosomal protein S11 N-terminal domain-containing protein n=1 Tax=Turnera subulata TaxID=218843 RepID=A0A9Q0JMX6_9ROSI|nr:hypothetical protein Tsubulata_002761 [Turnera subulata]